MPDASWGYTAEEGLKAVMGGGELLDKINKGEGAMSPQEMRAYIEAAPDKRNVSYSDESRRFAKAVLKIADKGPDEFLGKTARAYDFCKDIDGDYDLTGFMYGWAVNAIRYCLNVGPTRNPAIVEIEM